MGEPPIQVTNYKVNKPLEIKTLDECLLIVPKDIKSF